MSGKKKHGNAFQWTPEIEDEILTRIMAGQSVRKICATERDDFLPCEKTFYVRLATDDAFAQRYTRAREVQADALFDEALYISDTQVIGEKRKQTPDGKVEVTTGDMIEHRRLQVDTRKWMAGKLRPKVYGDKLDLNHGGGLTVTIGGDDVAL